MILTGTEIFDRMRDHSTYTPDIVIEPFDIDCLNPNSYNLHLSDKLLCYKHNHPIGNMGLGLLEPLDPKEDSEVIEHTIPSDGVTLRPGELYLGQTVEYTETRNLVPMIEGRSSWGRLGLFIHVTAGFGDIGFKGHWTLELSVVRPLILYPFVPIGQIFYHTVQGAVGAVYGGSMTTDAKYQGNKGVQPSMLWKEAHKWPKSKPE